MPHAVVSTAKRSPQTVKAFNVIIYTDFFNKIMRVGPAFLSQLVEIQVGPAAIVTTLCK